MDALRSLHWDRCDHDSSESDISDTLQDLSQNGSNDIRVSANTCFGYVAPQAFLHYIHDQIGRREIAAGSFRLREFVRGIDHAEDELMEIYYGSMCPGLLDSVRDDRETQKHEYRKMSDLLQPIVSVFAGMLPMEGLEGLLADLKSGLEEDGDPLSGIGQPEKLHDPYTLQLPFGGDSLHE